MLFVNFSYGVPGQGQCWQFSWPFLGQDVMALCSRPAYPVWPCYGGGCNGLSNQPGCQLRRRLNGGRGRSARATLAPLWLGPPQEIPLGDWWVRHHVLRDWWQKAHCVRWGFLNTAYVSGNLADLEEITPTIGRPNCSQLYEESVQSNTKHYSNHHVYPHTYQGGKTASITYTVEEVGIFTQEM